MQKDLGVKNINFYYQLDLNGVNNDNFNNHFDEITFELLNTIYCLKDTYNISKKYLDFCKCNGYNYVELANDFNEIFHYIYLTFVNILREYIQYMNQFKKNSKYNSVFNNIEKHCPFLKQILSKETRNACNNLMHNKSFFTSNHKEDWVKNYFISFNQLWDLVFFKRFEDIRREFWSTVIRLRKADGKNIYEYTKTYRESPFAKLIRILLKEINITR